ncbi:acyltransferase family protein [Microbacterium sp. RD1]|uniref:acyltransferase family protein n=1 Tax=Microbacterium sp. RD1 TaxID=3457313 RepID=UPI003FA570DA
MSRTLSEAFDPRRNSLNALRLVLATLVIVSHSWPIGGYGPDPGVGDLSLGEWAVAGFFGISGYLITMSRDRARSLGDYLWRRVLRIYPAFLVVLIVVAFVFAPFSVFVLGQGEWDLPSAFSYVWRDAALRVTQMGIPGTLEDVPYPGVWNGSLWTLWYEFLCYLVLGLAASIIPRRLLGRAIIVAVIALPLAALGIVALGTPSLALLNAATLGGYFAAGAALFIYGDRIPLRGWIAAVAAVLIVATAATSTFRVLAGLPVAYLMMWLGVVLPFPRVGAVNDISYGMYVYAFPVQQLLAMVLIGSGLPVAVFVVIAIAATVPFAAASWFLVERPAMKLKRLRWWRRRVTPPAE